MNRNVFVIPIIVFFGVFSGLVISEFVVPVLMEAGQNDPFLESTSNSPSPVEPGSSAENKSIPNTPKVIYECPARTGEKITLPKPDPGAHETLIHLLLEQGFSKFYIYVWRETEETLAQMYIDAGQSLFPEIEVDAIIVVCSDPVESGEVINDRIVIRYAFGKYEYTEPEEPRPTPTLPLVIIG